MGLLNGLTANCKEATLLSVKKEEKKLSFYAQLKLWMHLVYCASCRRFVRQSEQITGMVANYKEAIGKTPTGALTAEKKAALQKAINESL